MVRCRTVLLLIVLLCAAGCAFAAEEAGPDAAESPPTSGTITVEVRYKDSGEPVAGVFVDVGGKKPPHDTQVRETMETPKNGNVLFVNVPFGPYEVSVRNASPFPGEEVPLFRFAHDESEAAKTVAVSKDRPTIRLQFQVERGWRIEGTVKRSDGTPIPKAIVSVFQGKNPSWFSGPLAVTDEAGHFNIAGIAPRPTAHVEVSGLYNVTKRGRFSSGLSSGATALLWRGDVSLSGESSFVDIEVKTCSLKVNIEVLEPFWPFKNSQVSRVNCVGLRVGQFGEGEDLQHQHRVFLDDLLPERGSGLPKARYSLLITDLAADQVVTLTPGRRRSTSSGDKYDAHGFSKEVRLEGDTNVVELRIYAPGARLSRAFWFGVPALVVMVVCVVLLRRSARRRRAA